MALQLITGPSGSGKTYRLMTTVIEESRRHPDRTYLVIVPEQFSMQTQDILTAMHPGGAILNIDVLSFARLAYRVFDEVGFRQYELLEEIGKTFLLQKAALDKAAGLPYLGSRLRRPGCLADMKSVISELVQYEITPEKLTGAVSAAGDSFYRIKMTDIGTLYTTYREYLGDRLMTAEEVPDKLAEIADQSHLLKDAVIAFDGFTGFTPIQLKLIRKMLPLASDVFCTVTCDDSCTDDGEDALFHMSHVMIRTLTQLAAETGTAVLPSLRLTGTPQSRFGHAPALDFLEKTIFRRDNRVYGGECPEIALCLYDDPAREAEGCARRIASLVRTEGYRYRDFAVICGELAGKASSIRRAFREEGIPVFIDDKRPLLNNPFVETLRSAVEACVDGYSYDAVFRFLKAGMTDLTETEVSRLENYVLACGIRGKKAWRQPFTRPGRTETEASLAALNDSRRAVTALLDPLSEALAGRRQTVRDAAEALYRLCLDLRCQEKLEGRRLYFADNGRPDLEREYAQIYGKVMSILDKLVAVLGDEILPMGDFQALLEAGLAEIRIGVIPPLCDQVTVGDVERTRLKDVKILFFIGVQEGVIPKVPEESGFLNEADRERLQDAGLRLRPSRREAVYIQNFYLYLALTRPSDRLILSYTAADGSGKAVRPAYLISRLRRLFPKIRETLPSETVEALAERPADCRRLLAEPVRRLKDQEPAPAWYELYAWFLRHPEERRRLNGLLEGASYRKGKDNLSGASARQLYGRLLRNSATRLETFAACPFRHFADYGLRLKEREEYDFTGIDRGQLIHEALEIFGRRTREKALSWASLSDETLVQLSDESLMAAAAGHPYLTGDARQAYETERLRPLLRTTVEAIRQQIAAGDFEPGAMEAVFGDDADAAQVMTLPDGTRMLLTGRIDRIDICDEGDVRYLKVIDYKSGSKTFDMGELYYGLQLQLPLYLEAALRLAARDGRTVVPAALLYHTVSDPMITYEDGMTEEECREKRRLLLRGNGFVSSEPSVYRHLDRDLEPGVRSLAVPMKLNKNGSPDSRTQAGDTAAFLTISRYAVVKAAAIGSAIMGGETAVSPYRLKSSKACSWCPYHDICGFDERLAGCEYRELAPLDSETALAAMQERLNGGAAGNGQDSDGTDNETQAG